MLLISLSRQQQEVLFHLAHSVVVSDGELAPGEESLMEEMRREMGLSHSFQPHYLDPEGLEEIFDTRRARIIAIIALIRLGYADGAFEIEEQSFLELLCRKFDISDTDFSRIDNWVRRLVSLEKEINDLM